MFTFAAAWRTSRPRFWLYLLGPYLIGVAAAKPELSFFSLAQVIILGLFFLWPANLFLYGVNDYFDYPTDRLNPKKSAYESLLLPTAHTDFLKKLTYICLPFVLLLPLFRPAVFLALVSFLILSFIYSAPPIRTKARPLFDSLTNILYIVPALVGYFVAGGTNPNWLAFIAASFWAMAMHLYSAIPDINADQQAGISTTATMLGMRPALLVSFALWFFAALLAWPALGWFTAILFLPYASLVIISTSQKNPEQLLETYRWFPVINIATGALIFFSQLL